MSRRRRSVLVLVALVVAAGSALPSQAEVSAEVDRDGQYVRTIVLSNASTKNLRIWTVMRARGGYVALNPDGDATADLWPVIIEDPQNNNHPWVVWSRFNGMDYDLAWSRWVGDGWQDVRWLEGRTRTGQDIDPHLTLGDSGRPYVAWWTERGGLSRVYFSVFLSSRWMRGYLVSDDSVDSRFPAIRVNDDGSVTIDYSTPGGSESRTILFNDGVSINDDLDPVNSLTTTEAGMR